MRSLNLFLLIIFTGTYMYAEVKPKEGSNLNYTLIAFSYPSPAGDIREYSLEIADGNYSDELELTKHLIGSYNTKVSNTIVEVPSFGKQYTWQVTYKIAGNKHIKSELHHFSTLPLPLVKGCETRLLVTTPAKEYKDAYIFSDGNKIMYNMKGEPVWFLPVINDINPDSFGVRDFKLSPTGTITFIGGNMPYEINYEGKILWQLAKKTNTNDAGEGTFHHEFCKYTNGHYMIFGTEMVGWNRSKAGTCDSNSLTTSSTKTEAANQDLQLVPFTTLLEYDATKHTIWKWRSLDYLKKSDIFNHAAPDGYANLDAHANAFFFDQQKKHVYISFKDINRIITLQYPQGNVLAEYGEHYSHDAPEKINPLFSEQHAIKISHTDGSLFLFNDNIEHKKSAPSIVVFAEVGYPNKRLKKIWDFKCPTGTEPYPLPIISLGRHGGNVMEIPGQAYFVAMCSPYWNLFIVNKQKKILWEAIPQLFDIASQKWIATTSYRSCMITRKEMEELINSSKPVL